MTEIIPYSTRPTSIDGLVVITLKQVTDERGTICEFFRRSTHDESGLPDLAAFRQINVTATVAGAVRGLHAEAMTKLVSVVWGEAFGAYVDLRPDSPTSAAVETIRLLPGTQVLVPSGVANGFQAIVDGTQYVYAFDQEWRPGMAGRACSPVDPALGIDWPIPIDPEDRAQVSAKDLAAPSVAGVVGGSRA